MRSTNEIKDNFACHLRACLKSRYGKIPSAAVVARDFNLRAHGTSPISQESARRWIRGVSLPEEDRLRVLVNWLDLNFNDVLKTTDKSLSMVNKNNSSKIFDSAHKNGYLKKDQEIINLIFSLDEQQREVLSEIIRAIFNKSNLQSRASAR